MCWTHPGWKQKMRTEACNVVFNNCPAHTLPASSSTLLPLHCVRSRQKHVAAQQVRKKRKDWQSWGSCPSHVCPNIKSILSHHTHLLINLLHSSTDHVEQLMASWLEWFANCGFPFSKRPCTDLRYPLWRHWMIGAASPCYSWGPGNEDDNGDRSLDILRSTLQEVCKFRKCKITKCLRIPAVIWKVDFAHMAGNFAGPGGSRYIYIYIHV